MSNMEQIKLNHPEWYDFSKGADISEERKQQWLDDMIYQAQLFYRKKPRKKHFTWRTASGNSMIILNMMRTKQKFDLTVFDISSKGYRELNIDNFKLYQ